jgi:hypothetical protein
VVETSIGDYWQRRLTGIYTLFHSGADSPETPEQTTL